MANPMQLWLNLRLSDYIPASDASCPDDLGLMSLVVVLLTFRRDNYVGLVLVTLNPVWGGLCLLSFGLFFPGGVVLQV